MAQLTLSSTIPLSSGYVMPRLGFGVYQNYTTEESCLEAFKVGYRHVDSAQAYRNEAHVGEAVKKSGLRREDIFLTTKCISKYHGYEKTLKGVDESLKKFDVEYIDLFLIHNPHSGKDLRLATYKALEECRTLGKIMSVGVSNYGVKHIEEIRQADMQLPSVNQIELHPFCQQRDIVEYCQKHGIVVQAYCPVRFLFPRDQDLLNELEPLLAVAGKHNKEPAQIALRWSLQKGFAPLPKSAQPARILSNTQVYDFVLDEADMLKLDSMDRGKDGAISWNPVDVE
ncbi:hypothetical protein EIP91_001004 [Steccherinum ochraceum]|uniref:NADP-dependent oxidoreductase domain-containing protein n=1 Tax=Steccherinum ochraceum TaxID=92696 RepID=A0A4R0REW3_9APHY|nr:hypothetical protein EIP91_001004 [Steccherinum ochraceum]